MNGAWRAGEENAQDAEDPQKSPKGGGGDAEPAREWGVGGQARDEGP